jgi:hypothetical protein
MAVLVLSCKTLLAVLLLAAGGAKLADLAGFAATVRLFVPAAPRAIAAGVVAGEIAAGAASLCSPQAAWLNLVVLAIGIGFVAVSVAGYIWHPGRTCRCFGALSKRSFSLGGIARSAVIAAAAAMATVPVHRLLIQVALPGRLALLAGAAVVCGAAYTAASALGAGRDSAPGWA